MVRETQNRWPLSLTYRLYYGRTEANNVSFCAFFNACTDTDISELQQRRLLATATLGAKRIRVDNPLDPSEGNALTAEVTHSSRLIGSSKFAVFTRFVGDASQYFPSGARCWRCTSAPGWCCRPSWPFPAGASNFVPPEQRFYAGGPNDVRGYSRNELGPLVYVVEETCRVILLGAPSLSGEVFVRTRPPAEIRSWWQTPSFGFRRPCSGDSSVWRPSWTAARCGSAARGARVGPISGSHQVWALRFMTPFGPGPARRGLQQLRLPAGPALSDSALGQPGAAAGELPARPEQESFRVPVWRRAGVLMRRTLARIVFVLICSIVGRRVGCRGGGAVQPPRPQLAGPSGDQRGGPAGAGLGLHRRREWRLGQRHQSRACHYPGHRRGLARGDTPDRRRHTDWGIS